MNKTTKLALILLRIATGWYFLYQGIVAITNPAWSITSLLPKNATMFPEFYAYILTPSVLPYISYLVKGTLLLIGALIAIGVFVRVAALLGMVLVLFLYLPTLNFPYVVNAGVTYYIVDPHFILLLILVYLFFARAGEYFGLGTFFKFSRY